MDGRITEAPCGHRGRVVIGTYVECLTKGCAGLPKSETRGNPACGTCASTDTEPFTGWNVPPGSWHCRPCGKVWWRVDDGED